MAYRFKLDEPFDDGFRRIVTEQIDRAVAALEGAVEPAKSIHESRKSIKRIRALLRLVRPGLGEAAFARDNHWFRETAQLLSAARDREILLETTVKLQARYGDGGKSGLGKLHLRLSDEANWAANPTPSGLAARELAIGRLMDGRKRLARASQVQGGIEAVAGGLLRSYRRAGRALDLAYADPTPEAFHEWRKGVQVHWRHMALLIRAWPEYCEARLSAARRLSQILGDDHDLAILAVHVESAAGIGLSARERKAVVKLSAARQNELRAEAQPLGQRLFAEKPRGLARRITLYWQSAMALSAAERAAEPDFPSRQGD